MRGDEFFHRQEAGGVGRLCGLGTLWTAQPDESIDVVRHLDSGEVLATCLGNLDGDREIQAQARYIGERMRRVDGQWGQHRKDLVGEIRGKVTALVLRQVGPGDDENAVLGEFGPYRLAEYPGVLDRDLLRALTNQFQLLTRRQAVGRTHRQAGLVAAFQAGDADHVELVQIGREDRQELGALQDGQ